MRPRGKVVAVMQPYFLPFPGYFRLFAVADEVVLLDDVQFPKHGFVHRNRFRKLVGALDFLTLPLRSAPLDTQIKKLAFAPEATTIIAKRARTFEMFSREGKADAGLKLHILALDGQPVDVIINLLGACCAALDLPFADLRASRIAIPPGLRGQDRVLALAEARGAQTYVNAPGGRGLYDSGAFNARGLELMFLPDFNGAPDSIGQCLHDRGPDDVRGEILAQCTLQPA